MSARRDDGDRDAATRTEGLREQLHARMAGMIAQVETPGQAVRGGRMTAEDRLRKGARARVEATADHLRRTMVKVDRVREDRDVAIVRAYLAGLSLQDVAAAAGISRSRVAKLVRPAGDRQQTCG